MDNPTILIAPLTYRWRHPSFALVAVLFTYGVVLFAPAVLNDPDTYWHIEAGRWILDHRAVPHTDPFSFTMAGHPWVAHEWLSEVLMALAYRSLGWDGVVILFGAAAGATVGCLARYLAHRMHLLAAALTLMLGAACVSPSLLARPHLLALPLLALWTTGLLRAQESRTPPPWRLLALMLMWANLHASFVFGLALIAPIAADAFIDANHEAWRASRDWALFFAAALATALVTPHGWHGLVFPFQLASMHLVSSIGEWRPLDLNSLEPIEPAIATLLYVVVSRRVWISVLRWLILAGLLYLAYRHSRHEMLAGIVGAAVIAEPLGRAFGSAPAEVAARHLSWRDIAVGLACAALLTVLRFAHPIERGDGTISPVSALASVPADVRRAPVFNSYEFGGYLIFMHVRPFVDGRADMYGDAFMSTYLDAIGQDRTAFDRLLRQYRIRWALLATRSAGARMIAMLPGWRLIHRDEAAAVFVYDGP